VAPRAGCVHPSSATTPGEVVDVCWRSHSITCSIHYLLARLLAIPPQSATPQLLSCSQIAVRVRVRVGLGWPSFFSGGRPPACGSPRPRPGAPTAAAETSRRSRTRSTSQGIPLRNPRRTSPSGLPCRCCAGRCPIEPARAIRISVRLRDESAHRIATAHCNRNRIEPPTGPLVLGLMDMNSWVRNRSVLGSVLGR
jgi:hypothetical protein